MLDCLLFMRKSWFQWSKQSVKGSTSYFRFRIAPQIQISLVYSILCMPADSSNMCSETALLDTTTWNNTNMINFYTEALRSPDNPNAPYPSEMWSQVLYIGS